MLDALNLLDRIVDAMIAAGGELRLSTVTRPIFKSIRRRMKQWMRQNDGDVIASADPTDLFFLKALIGWARGRMQ